MKIDNKDQAILNLLKENSKSPITEIEKNLSKRYNLQVPPTTIHNRIKKLEKNGIIEQYTIKINRKLLIGEIIAFILIQISNIDQKQVMMDLLKHDEVEEVSIVTGENDLILRLRLNSIQDLNQFILDYLRKIEGISNSTTMIALDFSEK